MNVEKNTVKLFENDTSDETDEENDKYCFFQNGLDEENSDSEKSQEQSSKNDKSDIGFGSDDNVEEGCPVVKSLQRRRM